MAKILDGSAVAREMLEELKLEVKETGLSPKLAVIVVGDDPPSKIYVRNKEAACSYVGIIHEKYLLQSSSSQEELLNLIQELNKSDANAILLQLPLPKGLDEGSAIEAIDPTKDVDGLHPLNLGRLLSGDEVIAPCTPAGVIELLRRNRVELSDKHAVVVGRSNIVGKPLAAMLLNRDATVTVCHSKTRNIVGGNKGGGHTHCRGWQAPLHNLGNGEEWSCCCGCWNKPDWRQNCWGCGF